MHNPLIQPGDLTRELSNPDLRIFDLRHDLTQPDAGWRAYQHSRIPGAVFLDVEQDLAGVRTSNNGRHPLPDRHVFHDLMVRAGVGAESRVVAYDEQDGAMAARLWWMLRWLGFANVAVLDGGWQAWRQAALPVDAAPVDARLLPGAAAQPLPLGESLVREVSSADVVRNLRTHEFLVLDARAQARYQGRIEPLDPVAGHIPGALNRPYQENLDTHGGFKTPDVLRAEFGALLNERQSSDVVHQCGSGITACHNLIAMEYAGLPGSRLYPGSWSEWCSDPLRPVA